MVVNLSLIPAFGAFGAIVGTVCAEGAVCISQTIMVRKKIEVVRYLRDTVFYFAFGAVMFLVICILHCMVNDTVVAICIEILVGGGTYVVMSGLYTYQRNREMLRSIIKKRKM